MKRPTSISLAYQTTDRMGILWGSRMIELPANAQLMGCRLADWSNEPDDIRTLMEALEQEAPLDPGGRAFDCVLCGQQVRMGVRQQARYGTDPDAFTVTCLPCAAFFQLAMERIFGDGFVQVQGLGGR